MRKVLLALFTNFFPADISKIVVEARHTEEYSSDKYD